MRADLHAEAEGIVGSEMSSDEERRVKSNPLLEDLCLKSLAKGRPGPEYYASLVLRPDFDVNKQHLMVWGEDSDLEFRLSKLHMQGFGRLLTADVRKLKDIWKVRKLLYAYCQDLRNKGIDPPEEWSAVGDPGDFEPPIILYHASWSTEDGQGTVLDDFNGSLFAVMSPYHCYIDEDGEALISLTKEISEGFKPKEWRRASELKSGIDKLRSPINEFLNPNCDAFQVGSVLLKSDNLENHYGPDPFPISPAFEGELRVRACRRSIEAITSTNIFFSILNQNDDNWGGSPGD